MLLIFISILWIYCGKCSLRIKTNPQSTKLSKDTFIDVFDADDDQQYYLYPIKTNEHGYSLDNLIKKLSNNYSTFYGSIISIKTTHTQNENIFLLPYEICLGSVIGMNKYYSSFIIQTAAHCIVDHPQFQTLSRKKKTVSSLLIYMYSKTYNNPVLSLGILWLVIICAFMLCYYYLKLSCKSILLAFALLVIIINISVYFTQIEMLNNDAGQLLPILMDIKHSTYQHINESLNENDITMSKTCEVLYFSFDNLLDYNHAFMDPHQWSKIVFQQGDFAFLRCEYEPKIYKILSKYLRPSYPNIVDVELTKTLIDINKNGILHFNNLNKYVMLSGTFQRFVFDSEYVFVELHRKQICKQYIEQCKKNDKMLNDLTEWIKQYEQEKSIDYEYKQYTSIGEVTFMHSNQYFIGKFGAIQGWSGAIGVAGDNLNIIQTNAMNNTFHCILVQGSLDLEKYRGNWCMLVTHFIYAATYYKLVNTKSEYFDISKLNRKYKLYAKKFKKKGYSLNKFKPTKKSMTQDNTKIEF